jgi:nitrite reductase/ring-hydroxylating ferredoxin subunit
VESSLTRVALYHRRIRASSERVWENVRDWEHLPWLHAASFRSIALEDSGDWGWRAAIGLHGGQDIRLELVIEGERYVSRTLEGVGAGSEIWTTVRPHAPEQTDIEVEFCVPGADPMQSQPLGDMYLELYTQLWDEDERMMRERSRRLDARAVASEAGLDLGPEAALRATLPQRVELGGSRYQIAEVEGALVVYAAVCPHWLGPLGPPAADGSVTCPWHGYRFDVRSGRRCDAESPMRLPPTPRLEVTAGRVRLVPR